MRQAGVIAAAGLFALTNNIKRMQQDHVNASKFSASLSDFEHLRLAEAPQTNMVILDFSRLDIEQFKQYLTQRDIRISGNRWVFHQDISAADVETIIEICHQFEQEQTG